MDETMLKNRAAGSGHFLHSLRAKLASHTSRTAISYRGRSISYAELDAQAQCWAARLQQVGVEPGDRVAIMAKAKLPFLAAHLGTLYAAAVSLPINPRSMADELRYFLFDSGARVVVAGDDERPVVNSIRAELPELHAVLADVECPDASKNHFVERAIDADQPCLLLYSSGTTGRPKGVVHTHANVGSSLNALRESWRFTPDDVLVNVLPLFHIHGLSFATHLSLLTGSTLLMDDSFHPRRTMDLVGQGTVFMAIPTFYYSFLERPEFAISARQWHNVRLFTCGSAPLRAEILPELEALLGRSVINRYGMTEAHVISSLPLDGPWPQGSVGRPLPGVEVQVVKENGEPVGLGEIGSVVLRGPNLFREYWENPHATQAAFSGGWFDTGDLASRDASGFLTLVGRKNDLIITSGFNVYPQVIERVINDYPGVRESAVLGIPDKKRGERVVAVVVRTEQTVSEATLRTHVSERLVDYQRPATFTFVEALPRNAMGKVLRRELLAMLSRQP
jgi:malonyl-CoA/methylmalonyl-CoA synthetase